MKKLILGSIVLMCFSISISILQSSCSKSEAQNQSATNQLNKLIYAKMNGQIWVSNYDGSNATQVVLSPASNVVLDLSFPRFAIKLSPDGQKVFFAGSDTVSSIRGIYSCDITGANVALVTSGTGTDSPILCGAE